MFRSIARPGSDGEEPAELFVSAQNYNPNIRGLSVYALSKTASDKAALLAEKENKADLIAGIDLSTERPRSQYFDRLGAAGNHEPVVRTR